MKASRHKYNNLHNAMVDAMRRAEPLRAFLVLSLLLLLVGSMSAQSAGWNYVMTVCPLEGSVSEPSTDADMSRVTIEYLDDLGRKISTVNVGASYAVQDMADYITYDGRGRVSRRYLPFETPSSTGSFPQSAVSTAQAYHGDLYCFSETTYDGTADSRVASVTGPGQAWHATGKSVKTRHLFNNATGEGPHACVIFQAQGDSLINRGAYGKGRLRVSVTIDENGDSSAVYTDKGGRTILKRRFLSAGLTADTYYAYDICHRLRYVISPEGSNKLASRFGACDRETLRQYAIGYEYDGRNRCVSKRLPGQEPVYYVYDRLNRVILSQNGVQRLSGEWSVRKYDRRHRLAVEGRATLPDATRSSLQEQWGASLLIETHDAAIHTEGRLQYTDTCGIAGFCADRAYYYDDYSHWSGDGLNMPIPADAEYSPDMTYPPNGLQTGTAVSDYNGGYILTLSVYDPKGNVVLSAERDCYANEYMIAEFARYNFTGEMLSRKRVTSLLSEQTVTESHTERWSYSLDNRGRVTMITHRYGDHPARLLAEYSYDDMGRVSRWSYPGGSVSYDRNLRGWQTSQQSALFSQTLRYNATDFSIGNKFGVTSATPRYDGDISSITETRYLSADSAGEYSRVILYNPMGMITGVVDEEPDRFNEVFEYDLNGNIVRLYRGDYDNDGNGFDDLYMDYDGNRLTTITDYAWDDNHMGEIPQLTTIGEDTEYMLTYDAAGRLTSDASRSIVSISYTPEHLPTRIALDGDSLDIYLTYRADGVKRLEQTRRRYIKVITRVDGEGNVTTVNRPMTENHVRRYYGSMVTETGRDRRIYNEVGYIDVHNNGDSVSYHYYERDYLGSVRLVVNECGDIEQATDYCVGGLPSTRLATGNVDRRHHTSKEMLTFHGVSLYDNQARWYDPILCRFTTPDPLAEQYPDLSPYSHCANNPLTIVDPDGRVLRDAETKQIIYERKGTYIKPFTYADEGFYYTKLVKVDYGVVYADDGTPIVVYNNVYSNDSRWDTNCHGQTFLDGKYWLDDYVDELIVGDGYKLVMEANSSQDIIKSPLIQDQDVVLFPSETNAYDHSMTLKITISKESSSNSDSKKIVGIYGQDGPDVISSEKTFEEDEYKEGNPIQIYRKKQHK